MRNKFNINKHLFAEWNHLLCVVQLSLVSNSSNCECEPIPTHAAIKFGRRDIRFGTSETPSATCVRFSRSMAWLTQRKERVYQLNTEWEENISFPTDWAQYTVDAKRAKLLEFIISHDLFRSICRGTVSLRSRVPAANFHRNFKKRTLL